MSHYCCDCTYLDLDSANIYGKFWCQLRLERHMANEIECGRFCKAYYRTPSVAESAKKYSIEHSSSGGCFLTTIIYNILELPDNNYYLNTMRNFRKNVLQKDEKYKSILVEYDIIGPGIAKSLNDDPLKNKIALAYFNKYITPIVNEIQNNKYADAINLYINMTNSLKNLYSIDRTITNIEIDAQIQNNHVMEFTKQKNSLQCKVIFFILLKSYFKNKITSVPTIKQYIEKYINFPLFTIFLNHFVTKYVTTPATTIALK